MSGILEKKIDELLALFVKTGALSAEIVAIDLAFIGFDLLFPRFLVSDSSYTRSRKNLMR